MKTFGVIKPDGTLVKVEADGVYVGAGGVLVFKRERNVETEIIAMVRDWEYVSLSGVLQVDSPMQRHTDRVAKADSLVAAGRLMDAR